MEFRKSPRSFLAVLSVYPLASNCGPSRSSLGFVFRVPPCRPWLRILLLVDIDEPPRSRKRAARRRTEQGGRRAICRVAPERIGLESRLEQVRSALRLQAQRCIRRTARSSGMRVRGVKADVAICVEQSTVADRISHSATSSRRPRCPTRRYPRATGVRDKLFGNPCRSPSEATATATDMLTRSASFGVALFAGHELASRSGLGAETGIPLLAGGVQRPWRRENRATLRTSGQPRVRCATLACDGQRLRRNVRPLQTPTGSPNNS
jgi:hypothetical protein